MYCVFYISLYQIIGPGPDEVESLDKIKLSISTLKPYIQSRIQESRQLVQVLEIYPTGETGYKTAMTLSRLLQFVRKLVSNISRGQISPKRNSPVPSEMSTSTHGTIR